jgi:hypothetical protein
LPFGALCTTGRPISITGITANDATGGMHVVDWGTRYVGPHTEGLSEGGVPGPVLDQPGFGHYAVNVACRDVDGPTEVQFSISVAADSERATMTGLTLHYGKNQQFGVEFDVALCSTTRCPRVHRRDRVTS